MDDWLSAVPGSGTGAGTVTVTAAPMGGSDPPYRRALVRVTGTTGGDSRAVPVTQMPGNVLYDARSGMSYAGVSPLVRTVGELIRLPGSGLFSFGESWQEVTGLAIYPEGSADVRWAMVNAAVDLSGVQSDGCILAMPVHEGLYLCVYSDRDTSGGISIKLYDGEEMTEIHTVGASDPLLNITVRTFEGEVMFYVNNVFEYGYPMVAPDEDIQENRPLFIGQAVLDDYAWPPAIGLTATLFQVLEEVPA